MTDSFVGPLDVDGHDGDPAECPWRCRDVVELRGRRHHLLEDGSLLLHVSARIERRGAQQLVEGGPLLLAHDLPPVPVAVVTASVQGAATRFGIAARAPRLWR